MKFKILVLCMIMTASILFVGCEPNVDNDNPTGTPLSTTQRTTDNNELNQTTPSGTTNDGTITDEGTITGDDTQAVGVPTSTATFLDEIPAEVVPTSLLSVTGGSEKKLSRKKIGWGLGSDTDEQLRPVDALIAQEKYKNLDALFIDSTGDKKIYLTFDEGYENGYTGQILDILSKYNVRATFFITYDYAKRSPELVQRMIDDGHAVGNHSYTHPSFPDCSDREVRDEISKMHDYVLKNFSYEMNLIRFPMGEFSEHCLSIAKEMGYRSVFWSLAHADWDVKNQPDIEKTYSKLTKATHPGQILLLHAVSKTNTDCLSGLIDYWTQNGYKLSLF